MNSTYVFLWSYVVVVGFVVVVLFAIRAAIAYSRLRKFACKGYGISAGDLNTLRLRFGFSLALVVTWVGHSVYMSWWLIWRAGGAAAWMVDHWAPGVAVGLIISGGLGHIAALTAARAGWVWGFVLVLGAVAAGVVTSAVQ